jgi:hypothetical protein
MVNDEPEVVRCRHTSPVIFPARFARRVSTLGDLLIAPGVIAAGELRLVNEHATKLPVLLPPFLIPRSPSARYDRNRLMGISDGGAHA